MKHQIFALALAFCFLFSNAYSQENDRIARVVYLIGNTANPRKQETKLAALQEQIHGEKHPYVLIHLGDILSGESMDNPGADLDRLFGLVDGNPHGRLLFTAGDMDWNNSQMGGLKLVRELEEGVEGRAEDPRGSANIFLPSDGCPGPEILDLSPRLRLIFINTQWWLHPFDVPEAPDSDCSNLTREEVMESLEEAIEESDGRNVLIIGHHPLHSSGVYGGHMTLKTHLFPFADAHPGNWFPLPVLGSFHAAYRQNVGTVRDMANAAYQDFIDHMSRVLSEHPGLIYTSAHEYSLQLLEFENSFQVISGSISTKAPVGKEEDELFASSQTGYARLEYYHSGKIRIAFYGSEGERPHELYSQLLYQSGCEPAASGSLAQNRYYIPCLEEEEGHTELDAPFPKDSARVIAGNYPASGVKRMFLGSLHRDSWLTPVSVPYLNLDTTFGGLTPFALGGGRQTTTLKFRTMDGYEYAFRSVDKDLVNALPREFRNSFVGSMIKEVTATEYPYGAIVASALMDETDILHARPNLYVLPDHPGLGVFRESFAGLFGMLEERPGDPEGEREGFMGADDVTRSVGLFRKLYSDNDRYVDEEALGKARVFDMLIGDWGRHEDNWKWAGYDHGGKRVYYPIPRDRDHAFCRWNGMIPYLADREWAMPMVESFGADFKDIKSLTWPARHVDRFLLTELDHGDWKELSSDLARSMSDEVIDRAIISLPPELLPVSGLELGEMLKSRRDQLPEAVDSYYSLLARQVDVVGSNKHERVEVERMASGNVQVRMFKRNKAGEVFRDNPLYEREFVRKETREICIYGLDGEDAFHVGGSAPKSILVRIIGGPGSDRITDSSKVDGPRRHTLIYDTDDTPMTLGPESRDLTSEDPQINLYDRKAFRYNTYLPLPLVYYSSDDGFVASLGMKWTRHGFRKADFRSSHDISLRAGTSGNVQVGTENLWKEVAGKWDAGINIYYGHYYPYYNFFGLGNATAKDADLFEADYYKVYLKGLISNVFAENEIFDKGLFRMGLLYENMDSRAETDSLFMSEDERIPGANRLSTAGIRTRFYLDFRDRQVFATRGLQFLAENSIYTHLDGTPGNFGLAESYVKYFGTAKLLIPITMVVKLGGSKNYGEEVPFYKYAHLGQFSNLRGYKRNRFTGDASVYLNSELRFHLGRVRNRVLPFETGLIGFYDLGRVWWEGLSPGGWHPGYGGGFYISPFSRDYVFTLLFESSPEERLLFRFGFGFLLDN